MFKQSIDKTFLGTSDPVAFKHSLSYFGPSAPDTSDWSIVFTDPILDEYVDSHVGHSCRFKLTYLIEAGAALPSWAASITVEEGEVTSDTLKFTITDNTVMGGMYLGAKFTFNFSFGYRSWHNGHMHWGWHSHWVHGHWNDWHTFDHSINFDIIPFALNAIRKIADDVPKLKILNDLLPQGIIDHMQDFEYDIINEQGEYINASIPLKWDLVMIGRAIAETGIEVATLELGPAELVIAAIVEISEFVVSLMNTLKVVQIAFGPEINIEFPLRIRITDLVALDSQGNEYVYDQLSFNDNGIVATNTGNTRIPDDQESGFITRIGVRCQQSIEVPLQTNPGVWAHFGLFWVFAASPAWDFSMIDHIEKHFDVDLGLAHFTSEMTNDVGGEGTLSHYGGVPSSVDVKFV